MKISLEERTRIFKNIDLSSNTVDEKNRLMLKVDYFIEKNLPIIFDTIQINQLFNIDKKFLETENFYMYEIHKKNNSIRYIYQPDEKLKDIQSWILKNILNYVPISSKAHAFTKNKSILTNAKVHYYPNEKFWLLSMDLSNFFDTITLDSVQNLFINLGYSKDVSSYLASLCCVNLNLVQGFPTSPAISNIILKELDIILLKHCNSLDIRYSRYADDLFFSSSQEITNTNLINLKAFITEKILEFGFVVNNDKTHFYSYSDVKKITGLVVRENGIFVPQKTKRKIYKEIYYCKKFGIDNHLAFSGNLNKSNFKGYMYGYAYFIKMVEPEVGIKILNDLNEIFY